MDLVFEQQFRNFNQNILPVREASKIQALKDGWKKLGILG